MPKSKSRSKRVVSAAMVSESDDDEEEEEDEIEEEEGEENPGEDNTPTARPQRSLRSQSRAPSERPHPVPKNSSTASSSATVKKVTFKNPEVDPPRPGKQ